MHLKALSIQDSLLDNLKEWKEKQKASWNNLKWMHACAHTHTHMYIKITAVTSQICAKEWAVSALTYYLWKHRYTFYTLNTSVLESPLSIVKFTGEISLNFI